MFQRGQLALDDSDEDDPSHAWTATWDRPSRDDDSVENGDSFERSRDDDSVQHGDSSHADDSVEHNGDEPDDDTVEQEGEGEAEGYSDSEVSDGGGQQDHDTASFLSEENGDGRDGATTDHGPDSASDDRGTEGTEDHNGDNPDYVSQSVTDRSDTESNGKDYEDVNDR